MYIRANLSSYGNYGGLGGFWGFGASKPCTERTNDGNQVSCGYGDSYNRNMVFIQSARNTNEKYKPFVRGTPVLWSDIGRKQTLEVSVKNNALYVRQAKELIDQYEAALAKERTPPPPPPAPAAAPVAAPAPQLKIPTASPTVTPKAVTQDTAQVAAPVPEQKLTLQQIISKKAMGRSLTAEETILLQQHQVLQQQQRAAIPAPTSPVQAAKGLAPARIAAPVVKSGAAPMPFTKKEKTMLAAAALAAMFFI